MLKMLDTYYLLSATISLILIMMGASDRNCSYRVSEIFYYVCGGIFFNFHYYCHVEMGRIFQSFWTLYSVQTITNI